MKKLAFIVLALAGSLAFAQARIDADGRLLVSDAQVYIAMVHTPNGHVLQKAPLSQQFYEHLQMESGPATVRSAFVGDFKEFYGEDLAKANRDAMVEGTVQGKAKIAIAIPRPKSGQDYPLPEGLSSDKPNLRFAIPLLSGELSRAAYKDGDGRYWLRPTIDRPLEKTDGKLLLAFSKLELGLYAWFSEDATISGDRKAGELVLHFASVPVKKGWNLLAVMWGDGSEIFKGDRYVNAASLDTPLYEVFIPYW